MIVIRVRKRFLLDLWVVRVSASRPNACSASFSLRGRGWGCLGERRFCHRDLVTKVPMVASIIIIIIIIIILLCFLRRGDPAKILAIFQCQILRQTTKFSGEEAIGDEPNTVSESTVSNTNLSELFWLVLTDFQQ